jgi:ribosomal protein L6P/L9E
MSRVGKMPVTIPAGVDVSIKDDSDLCEGFWWYLVSGAKRAGQGG